MAIWAHWHRVAQISYVWALVWRGDLRNQTNLTKEFDFKCCGVEKNTSTVLFNTSHRGHWKSSKCCKHQWKHVFVLLPDGHEVLQSFYAMTMEKWRIQNTPRSNIRMWPNACFFPALGCFKLPAIVFISFLAVRYLPLAAFNCLHLHPFMCCLVLPPTACYTSAPTKAKGFGI